MLGNNFCFLEASRLGSPFLLPLSLLFFFPSVLTVNHIDGANVDIKRLGILFKEARVMGYFCTTQDYHLKHSSTENKLPTFLTMGSGYMKTFVLLIEWAGGREKKNKQSTSFSLNYVEYP